MNISRRPAIPRVERLSSTRKGFRPPMVSTQAENGILRSDPESSGAATAKPRSTGDRPMPAWSFCAIGPKRATAAKPTKKPSVAPTSPSVGVPFSVVIGVTAIDEFEGNISLSMAPPGNTERSRGTTKTFHRSERWRGPDP